VSEATVNYGPPLATWVISKEAVFQALSGHAPSYPADDCCPPKRGSGTTTTQSCKNGARTLSRKNFSGNVGHVTVFS